MSDYESDDGHADDLPDTETLEDETPGFDDSEEEDLVDEEDRGSRNRSTAARMG